MDGERFIDAFAAWLEVASLRPRTARIVSAMIEEDFRQFLTAPVRGIRVGIVRKWLQEIEQKRGRRRARQCRAVMGYVIEHARQRGLASGPNPAVSVIIGEDDDSEDIPRSGLRRSQFFRAMERRCYEDYSDFLYLCAYTDATRAEVASMRWHDVDLNEGCWRVRTDGKRGRRRLVPLAKGSRLILEARRQESGGDYIFPAEYALMRKADGRGWKTVVSEDELEDPRALHWSRFSVRWRRLSEANRRALASAEYRPHNST